MSRMCWTPTRWMTACWPGCEISNKVMQNHCHGNIYEINILLLCELANVKQCKYLATKEIPRNVYRLLKNQHLRIVCKLHVYINIFRVCIKVDCKKNQHMICISLSFDCSLEVCFRMLKSSQCVLFYLPNWENVLSLLKSRKHIYKHVETKQICTLSYVEIINHVCLFAW